MYHLGGLQMIFRSQLGSDSFKQNESFCDAKHLMWSRKLLCHISVLFKWVHKVDAVISQADGKRAIWTGGSSPSGLIDLWVSDEQSSTGQIKRGAVCRGLAALWRFACESN